jgi:hypothetical protein
MYPPRFALCCGIVLLALTSARAAGPAVVSVEKIWDRAPHNAFTDLIRWRNRWYCTFREAEAHVGGNGKLRVLESADGKKWESAVLVAEEGIDLRDPKLSITPDDRLMLLAGGSVYEGKTLKGFQPRVAFSGDGRTWTAPRRVVGEGEWLWRVTWHGGKAYGVSYSNGKDGKRLKLFVSSDGVKYDLVTPLDVPGEANETTLRFLPDGEMIALVRRDGAEGSALIGRSRPPFKTWIWKETKHRVGGPNFLRLPDGTLWAAGRSYPGGAKTILARMTPAGDYEPALTLTSGGDTSYPGLVWHGGLLWMSFYSSHEGKSAIYLTRIRVPLEPEDVGSRVEPFVDDYLLERLGGSATLRVQRPEPREVVLTADKPWEGNTSAYFTIFQDGDRYRAYYRGANWNEKTRKPTHREVTCYAESKDGVTWTKPELGLVEFDGSKRNNIVWDGGPTSHNFTPFRDTNPKCPPGERYKALAGGRGGLTALKSADGLHWQPMADKPVITQGAFDSQNLAFWDANAGKYREYHRQFRGVRDVMTGTSDDFLHWTEPTFLDYPGAALEHLYTNAVLPFPRAPHVLIGFPTRFLPAHEQTEPTFMASRDGTTFRRYAEAIIPTTAPEDRGGNRSNYLAWGVVRLPGRDRELSVYATERYYAGPGSRLRRFTYRLDGFVALHAETSGGEAVTRPLRFQGSNLILNYRTGSKGVVRVEMQDADGNLLENYVAELHGDDVAGVAKWRMGNLKSLAGKSVRVRFVLTDADLFSFRFE